MMTLLHGAFRAAIGRSSLSAANPESSWPEAMV
jgi:hypothetical protein